MLRLGAATSAIAMATMIYLFVSHSGSTKPAEMGNVIFLVLSGFAFLYALLIGVRVTSDCISSEKREGTLGLLFLTDLKGLDIVLGKLAASALDSFYALVSTLPVLAIPILLGSVTIGEIWRAMLSLLATALFSICAGMFVSAFSVNERKATAGTFLLIVGIAAGIPIAVLILSSYLGADETLKWLFTLSPGTSIVAALTNNPKEVPWLMYWLSLSITLFLAFALTMTASIIVPRIWQQRVEGAHDRSGARARAAATGAARQQRQQQLDVSPTCWLAGRGHLRGLWLWVFLVCVLLGWLWAFAENPGDMQSPWMNLGWMFFVQGVIKIFITSEAVRTYAEDSRQGSLELILCTPLPVPEIIRGQLLNLVRYFRWPMVTLLLADLLFLVLGRMSGTPYDSMSTVTKLFVALMVFFFVDGICLGILGLWRGLIGRNSRQALTSGIVRILVLPWILFGLINLIAAQGFDRGIPEDAQLPLAIAISLVIDGFFGWQAWDQIHLNLRAVAASRYGGGRTTRKLSRRVVPRLQAAQEVPTG